ncbi:helix-turn-helix domain-containing protein [Thermomonas fusca]|uniref:helix-turn-helix domain-containing protein n=1 Tax=Thermomonas fusca TaxID=215690 RepID=UPI00048B28BE|nr:helix-turn-helix transcriptional regulator [Thermomonas fusca]
MDSLGIRIRVARRRKNMTQADLAAALGVSRSAVGNWEGCAKTVPECVHLLGIAAATGVSCDWLISGNGEPCSAMCGAARDPSVARNCTEQQVLLAFRHGPPRTRSAILKLLDVRVVAPAE